MAFSSFEFNFDLIEQLTFKDRFYANSSEKLKGFYHFEPTMSGFEKSFSTKVTHGVDRLTLNEVLIDQYDQRSKDKLVSSNVNLLLNEDSFTITTAHQPTLFTGPLYYIIKILSTIRLCEQLAKEFPAKTFIPLFVLGGEDHDFEECNHLYLFNKKVEWKNNKGGAVGRLDLFEIDSPIKYILELLRVEKNDFVTLLESLVETSQTYGEFMLSLTHELFKSYGLVVLSMDDARFKQQMISIFENDILLNSSFDIVSKTQNNLSNLGFSSQANPREINLFYLEDHKRNRIVKENNLYRILNTDRYFTKDQIINELHDFPEKFSPNVILRPLLQEKCLPNLAYIGGGGEIGYWLERKEQFDYYSLKMPLLIRRDSLQIISNSDYTKWTKFGFELEEIFLNIEKNKKKYVQKNADSIFPLKKFENDVNTLFSNIEFSSKNIDPNLMGTINALKAKTIKGINVIESKYIKAQKRNFDIELNRITKVYNKIYPFGSLMERKLNIIECIHLYGDTFIQDIYEHIDPLNKNFKVLIED